MQKGPVTYKQASQSVEIMDCNLFRHATKETAYSVI